MNKNVHYSQNKNVETVRQLIKNELMFLREKKTKVIHLITLSKKLIHISPLAKL